MNEPDHNSNLFSSTAAGSLPVFINIHYGNFPEAALLAAIGAVVSFGVSLLLKIMWKRFKR